MAWSGTPYCRSCHDAGDTDHGPGISNSSFPHYTYGYYRFMTSGESLESSGTTSAVASQDGLCLKCHRSGTSGVGENY